MRTRGWLIAAGVFAALTVAFHLIDANVQTVAYVATGVASAACLFVGAWWQRRRRPLPWVLLGVAMLLWTAGDVVFERYAEVYPSPADILYLAGYPVLAAALVVLVHRRIRGSGLGSALDAAILASGAALGAYVYLLSPLASLNDVGWLEKLVSLSYPVSDLLLLGLCARLAFSRRWRHEPVVLMLLAALACLLAADLAYVYLQVTSGYEPGLLDLGWLASYGLLAVAALHPSSGDLSDPVPEDEGAPTNSRMVALGAATLIAPAVLASQALRGDELDGLVIAVVAALLFVLVTYRMAVLVRQVQRQAEQLDILSRTDSLTGALNRRALEARLSEELARASRERTGLALAMLDVDRFKHFNDTWGHQAGDRFLRDAVTVWSEHLRPTDVLARYGGEEFVILLPACTASEAFAIMERLRTATPDGETCSAGIAVWDGTESGDSLLGRADSQLYLAKERGRDRTELGVPAAHV
jgi:diguanylate cyclase (GGDEF)-like protein